MEITDEEYARLQGIEEELKTIKAKEVNKPVEEPIKPQVDLFDEYCRNHYDKRSKK